MNQGCLPLGHFLVALLLLHPVAADGSADQPVELIATIRVPGDAIDKSGRGNRSSFGIPHNLFGGISGLEYLGRDDLYWALSDRGPKDGAVDWDTRVHVVRIPVQQLVDGTTSSQTAFAIEDTVFLKENDRHFSGFAELYEATDARPARLDPEGIRVNSRGNFYLSDEYGPHLLEFTAAGSLVRALVLPRRYQIRMPGLTKQEENRDNQSGRQGNRGVEGLAISSDGSRLYGLFQSPLLQDCWRADDGKPLGLHCRLFEYNVEHGSLREFAYRLDDLKNKLNEILTLDAQRFLVIERDGKAGSEAEYKKIICIDLESASEVHDLPELQDESLPSDLRPVKKETFIDLLDPRFGLSGDAMPEKIEGLTFGPTLSDGRRTLLIASDNDFKSSQPTVIYCFAIGQAASAPQGVNASNGAADHDN